MKSRRVFLIVLVLGLSLRSPPASRATASLELYGTFHAMGVIVTLDSGDDPDGNATATLEYRAEGGTYRAGFPLSRVNATRFVGSLFWLEPGTSYDIRVTLSDPGGLLDGVSLEDTASTRAEIVVPAPTQAYYVSPGGDGTACSEAAPCALSYALNQAQTGQAVVLRGGVYYEGEFELPRSGTEGAPIMIQGYPGESAILDGADPGSEAFSWTHQGSGLYRTTVNVAGTHLVMADGQRLFPYDDLDDLQNLSRDNTPGFYADGTTLYVHLAGNADPNAATLVVSRLNNAFTVEQDHVYFLDLTLRHYGQGNYAKAIYLNDASDNLVQGCTFASNDLGIGIKRDAWRNVVQDNEFYDTIFDWPWADIKELGGLEDGGVAFYDPATGRGNVIRRNVFHDDFDGLGVCPSESAALTNETDVYENLIYNMGDDGMETDGQCSNVRIWGNTFHDVLMGISLAPVYDGPVYAVRNLIYRTGVGNNDYSGSPFKFNSGYDQSGPMVLLHNTADAFLPGNNGLYIKAPGTWDLIYARNNVWSGTDYALHNYNETQPVDLDYDDLYTTRADEFVYWGSSSERHMRDLPTFQSLTGQELHGLNVAPGFADAAQGDYALDDTSALLDAGLVIPGINDDYVCMAPDIGAFESQACGFTPRADAPARAIAPGDVAVYEIEIQPIGGFSHSVTVTATSPSPSLTLSLDPTVVTPPGQVTLTLEDNHTSVPSSGLHYTVPITASGGGYTQSLSVQLLVGGLNVYLPLAMKNP
jgi:parallel beta-helix repeat protein